MPPTTASSHLSFATRRLVRSARLSTLTSGASIVGAVTYDLSLELGRRQRISAGEERRQDEHHRALGGEGLLNRLVDDERHGGLVGQRVVRDRDRIESRTQRPRHRGLAGVELTEGAALR